MLESVFHARPRTLDTFDRAALDTISEIRVWSEKRTSVKQKTFHCSH